MPWPRASDRDIDRALDTLGNPARRRRVVLISVGMSNATLGFRPSCRGYGQIR
jgi:hypothetical protein